MNKSCLLGVVLASLFAIFTPFCNAANVTFNFEFEVTAISDRSFFNYGIGDRLTGSMTYETTTTGTPTLIGSRDITQLYSLIGSPNEITLNINNGYMFTDFKVTVGNDLVSVWPPEIFEVRTTPTDFPGFTNVDFGMDIWSSDPTTFDMDSLPSEPINIGDANTVRAVGGLSIDNPNNSQVREGLNFVVISMTSAVPISPALWLFGSGLIGV